MEKQDDNLLVFVTPVPSGWRCELFGMGKTGITWRPAKGNVPNVFWRTMQFLLLGNRWVKED